MAYKNTSDKILAAIVLDDFLAKNMNEADELVKNSKVPYIVVSKEITIRSIWKKFLTIVSLKGNSIYLITEHQQDEKSFANLLMNKKAFVKEVLAGYTADVEAA